MKRWSFRRTSYPAPRYPDSHRPAVEVLEDRLPPGDAVLGRLLSASALAFPDLTLSPSEITLTGGLAPAAPRTGPTPREITAIAPEMETTVRPVPPGETTAPTPPTVPSVGLEVPGMVMLIDPLTSVDPFAEPPPAQRPPDAHAAPAMPQGIPVADTAPLSGSNPAAAALPAWTPATVIPTVPGQPAPALFLFRPP